MCDDDGDDWLNEFRGRVSETLVYIDEEKDLHSHNLFYLGIDLCGVFTLFLKALHMECTFADVIEAQICIAGYLSALDNMNDIEYTASEEAERLKACLSDCFSPDRTLHKYEFLV